MLKYFKGGVVALSEILYRYLYLHSESALVQYCSVFSKRSHASKHHLFLTTTATATTVKRFTVGTEEDHYQLEEPLGTVQVMFHRDHCIAK